MTLFAAGCAVVLGMCVVAVWSHQTEMKLLYGRLGEKEAADVIASLEAQGVKYQIGAGGTSIYVPSDRVHRVRIDLAAKGLPGGEGVGFEIFDRSNFGISDFVQRTNFARALQGELARTIAQVNGVRSARVMVVMPENRLLLKTADTRPTASVFVEVGSGTLSADAVNSIRALVANAVEGLHVDDVAVIDSHGNVLSEELKADPLLGSAASQMKFRKHVEDYLATKVETMLGKVLGVGKAVVRVAGEIDNAGMTSVEEKYDPESQVVRSETLTDDSTLTSERSAEGKPAGVSSNVPAAGDPNGGDGAQGKSTEEMRKNKTQTYEINKVTTNTQKAPGAIRKVSAAVLLAQRPKSPDGTVQVRSQAELDSLRQMVVNALGVQAGTPEEAAKIVTLQEVAFEAVGPEQAATSEKVMGYLEALKPLLGIALAGGIFVYFVKMLRSSHGAGQLELLRADEQEFLRDAANVTPRNLVSPEMLNELIQQKPDNVAAALRGWMAQKDSKAQ